MLETKFRKILFCKFLVVNSLLLLDFAAAAAPSTDAVASLAEDVRWRRLLHLPGGSDQSRVDNSDYFISPNGRNNPRDELSATLVAMRDPAVRVGRAAAPAACVFPARFALLQSVFKDLPEPTAHPLCEELREWKTSLNASSVTLVFAGAYPNNPASMFGHTLLRLDPPKKQIGEPQASHDLLSYVVHFAARTGLNDDPISYTLRGVFGGYPGEFLLVPYYEMVNVYAGFESRDMWEYSLQLSSAVVSRLVEHLWELMHNATFDYWFADENCSFQLLALLEAAEPSLDLTAKVGPWVLPLDTIRAVQGNNILLASRRRDSLRRQTAQLMVNQSSALDKDIALLRFKKMQNKGFLPAPAAADYQLKLSQRAKLSGDSTVGEGSERLPTQLINPLDGHRSKLIWSGFDYYGRPKRDQFFGPGMTLGFRAGAHGFSDPPRGYNNGQEVNFGSVEARFSPRAVGNSLTLSRWSLLEVTSLTPVRTFDFQWSWRAAIDGRRGAGAERSDGAEGAVGVAGDIGQITFGLLSGARIEAQLFNPLILLVAQIGSEHSSLEYNGFLEARFNAEFDHELAIGANRFISEAVAMRISIFNSGWTDAIAKSGTEARSVASRTTAQLALHRYF